MKVGCLLSPWDAPSLYGPPLQGAQTGPCALQALSFTGLLPACVPRLFFLISAP